jgi:hypothetical protein
MKTKIIMFILLLSITLPLSALTFYKQSRVTVPEWYGIICIDNYLCLEDITKKDEAKKAVWACVTINRTKFVSGTN